MAEATSTTMKKLPKVEKIDKNKNKRKLHGDEAALAAGLRSLKIEAENQILAIFDPTCSTKFTSNQKSTYLKTPYSFVKGFIVWAVQS